MAENHQPLPGDHGDATGNALAHKVAQKAHNLKYLVLAALVIVAAAIAIVGYVRSANAQKQIDAANNVFRLRVETRDKPPAEIAAAFAKAARDHAGTPAGIQASAFAFGYALDAKDFAAAERTAADFLKTYPSNPLVPRFRLSLAQTQLQQGKISEAIASLRDLTVVSAAIPEVFAEAKLTMAQALEMNALAVQDNPDEYRRRLQAAEAAFSDITSQSRLPSPSQRLHWPQAVVLTADFALVQIKDRLAGHEFQEPVGQAPVSLTPEDIEVLRDITPPADPLTEVENAATAAAQSAADAAKAAADAVREAGDKLDAAATSAAETAAEAKESAAAAVQAATDAVQDAERKAEAATANAAGAVEDKAADAAETVEEKAEAAVDAVKDQAERATEALENAAEAAEEKAASAVDAVEEAAAPVIDAVKEAAAPVIDAAKDATERAAEAIVEKADAVADAVTNAVEPAQPPPAAATETPADAAAPEPEAEKK